MSKKSRTIVFDETEYNEIRDISKETGISFNRLISDGGLKYARKKRAVICSNEEDI